MTVLNSRDRNSAQASLVYETAAQTVAISPPASARTPADVPGAPSWTPGPDRCHAAPDVGGQGEVIDDGDEVLCFVRDNYPDGGGYRR